MNFWTIENNCLKRQTYNRLCPTLLIKWPKIGNCSVIGSIEGLLLSRKVFQARLYQQSVSRVGRRVKLLAQIISQNLHGLELVRTRNLSNKFSNFVGVKYAVQCKVLVCECVIPWCHRASHSMAVPIYQLPAHAQIALACFCAASSVCKNFNERDVRVILLLLLCTLLPVKILSSF